MRVKILASLLSGAAAVLLAESCSPAVEGESAGDAESAPALVLSSSDAKWGACPPIFPAGCEIAVLHGDPAQPNADVFLRVPADYAIPPHWHTSAERMILVSGALEVAYEGQPRETLAAGDYAYGPPKRPHEARCVSDEPCTLFIAFEGAVDANPVQGAAQ